MPVNAIDFSDLTGVKQQPKPQGFYSPDKIPEQKNPKSAVGMGYPTQQTQNGDELLQLFPTPILICPYPVDYKKELEWINNQECRKENKGVNAMHGSDQGPSIHYNRQSEDTFVLDRPELANVRAFIEAKLHEYVTKIYSSTDKLVITQSWFNKSKKG